MRARLEWVAVRGAGAETRSHAAWMRRDARWMHPWTDGKGERRPPGPPRIVPGPRCGSGSCQCPGRRSSARRRSRRRALGSRRPACSSVEASEKGGCEVGDGEGGVGSWAASTGRRQARGRRGAAMPNHAGSMPCHSCRWIRGRSRARLRSGGEWRGGREREREHALVPATHGVHLEPSVFGDGGHGGAGSQRAAARLDVANMPRRLQAFTPARLRWSSCLTSGVQRYKRWLQRASVLKRVGVVTLCGPSVAGEVFRQSIAAASRAGCLCKQQSSTHQSARRWHNGARR